MKTIKKDGQDQNISRDNICYIQLNSDTQLEIRITFAFHLFLEQLCNEACGLEKSKAKPLIYFADRACRTNFIIPANEVVYILKGIVERWFGYKKLEVKNINHNLYDWNLSWRRELWKKVASPQGDTSKGGSTGRSTDIESKGIDVYKWQYISLTFFGIQPSEFWNMCIEDFFALVYNMTNKGVDPMNLQDFFKLKKQLGG